MKMMMVFLTLCYFLGGIFSAKIFTIDYKNSAVLLDVSTGNLLKRGEDGGGPVSADLYPVVKKSSKECWFVGFEESTNHIGDGHAYFYDCNTLKTEHKYHYDAGTILAASYDEKRDRMYGVSVTDDEKRKLSIVEFTSTFITRLRSEHIVTFETATKYASMLVQASCLDATNHRFVVFLWVSATLKNYVYVIDYVNKKLLMKKEWYQADMTQNFNCFAEGNHTYLYFSENYYGDMNIVRMDALTLEMDNVANITDKDVYTLSGVLSPDGKHYYGAAPTTEENLRWYVCDIPSKTCTIEGTAKGWRPATYPHLKWVN